MLKLEDERLLWFVSCDFGYLLSLDVPPLWICVGAANLFGNSLFALCTTTICILLALAQRFSYSRRDFELV